MIVIITILVAVNSKATATTFSSTPSPWRRQLCLLVLCNIYGFLVSCLVMIHYIMLYCSMFYYVVVHHTSIMLRSEYVSLCYSLRPA